MNKLETILTKYKEFKEFVQSIDVSELKENYTRKELTEFNERLWSLNVGGIWSDVNQIIKEKKFEEYPELLGVHNFPVLKEITFMTEEEKIKFDKELLRFRVGEYLPKLWRYTKKEKELEEFLVKHKVISKHYVVRCACGSHWLSDVMEQEAKDNFMEMIEKQEHADEEIEQFGNILHTYCDECEGGYDCDLESAKYSLDMGHIEFKELLVMKMERDTSLDNV